MQNQKNQQKSKSNSILNVPYRFVSFMKDSVIMFALLLVYFIVVIVRLFTKVPIVKIPASKLAKSITNTLEKSTYSKSSISRLSLIELAFRNIAGKKSRAFITVGGMAIGIGLIVFLLSLGYGVQSLVVNKIASLGELRQFEASARRGSKVTLNEETLTKVADYTHVVRVYPQIDVVGRVKSNNSFSDVPVYAVGADFFQDSPDRVEQGRFYTAEEQMPISTALDPSSVKGVEDSALDLESESLIANAETGATTTASDGTGTLDLIDLGTTIDTTDQTKEVSLEGKSSNVVVINRAMLPILGIGEAYQALNKTVEFTLVVSANQTADNVKVVTTTMRYVIVGVMSDDQTPLMYIPFNDARTAGVVNYSMFKVLLDDESNMTVVRKQIEALGFTTNSVLDTIVQVNSIFNTLNVVLAVIGMMALLVASLGMFNTLTVSLLERTREVGLLKTLGMKSREVRDLFLAESLIMGIEGGVIGLIAGTIAGKVVGLLITALFISNKNSGVVMAYVPNELIAFIVVLALIVGIFTGMYPARRAMKISALDALRYE